MKKTLKKVTAAVMAAVMTVGIAASVNAESDLGIATMADIDCKHPQVIKVNTGFELKSTRTHTIKVKGPTGLERIENCVVNDGIICYYYDCKFCGKRLQFVEAVEISKHLNPLCGQ